MSCIVAIETDAGVWMGGDSQLSNAWTKFQTSEPKVVRNGDFLFGVTGSIRPMNLLAYKFTQPVREVGESDEHYIFVSVVDALRDMFKYAGYAKVDSNIETFDGAFLMAYSGRLYVVYKGFEIATVADRYASIGSGYEVALGALHSMKSQGLDPEAKIKAALDAASHHTPYVGPPYTILFQAGPQKGKEIPGSHYDGYQTQNGYGE